MALKRAFRLRKSSEFLRVRQQGRSITSRLLILAYVANNSETTRIGFVVSKRVSKHAVERNYIKRLLSETVRPLLPGLPNGLDIVLSVRSGHNERNGHSRHTEHNAAVNADAGMLKQEVVSLLHRARLLSNGQTAETSS
ncbi:MAG TPA: ribonuclease P protein component [Ktedonobacteraceae bacterium]|nr:ribonuclease P protein component [Ktedonobacteraceae bacterium]